MGAAVLFLTEWLPIGVTALGIPVLLLISGVITDPQVALQGFGNNALIAVAAVFVMGAGLQESGVASFIAGAVRKFGGTSEVRLIVLITVTVAVLSAFMSNAATVAVLIPAVVTLSKQAKIPSSRLLMPLAFGAILGGNLTLIGTSSNILLGDRLAEYTGEGFGVFEFAVVGGPIVVVGILFMAVGGIRMLPKRDSEERFREAQLPENLARSYQLLGNLFLTKIGANSGLLGKTIADAGLGSRYKLSAVMVVRRRGRGSVYMEPTPDLELKRGDQLYLEGDDEAVMTLELEETTQIGLPEERHLEQVLRHGLTLAEIILSPRSRALGKSFRELEFRSRYGLSVISMWRQGAPVHSDLGDLPLEQGDALLVYGSPRRLQVLSQDQDFVVLTEVPEEEDLSRAPIAVALLLLGVVPTFFGIPLAVSALAAAVLMVGTKCVTLENAERSIDWRVLFLIIGTLPLGTALEEQGIASQVGNLLMATATPLGNGSVLFLLFALAATISITTSNAAAAVILAPIAKAAAVDGVDLHKALLAVAYGCSCAFIVPFAHQCNLMVLGPGGYRTRDFVLIGSVMSVLVAITAVLCLTLL
ncbi:MAG: SLC13 family permease [Planctomycetota bacterium]